MSSRRPEDRTYSSSSGPQPPDDAYHSDKEPTYDFKLVEEISITDEDLWGLTAAGKVVLRDACGNFTLEGKKYNTDGVSELAKKYTENLLVDANDAVLLFGTYTITQLTTSKPPVVIRVNNRPDGVVIDAARTTLYYTTPLPDRSNGIVKFDLASLKETLLFRFSDDRLDSLFGVLSNGNLLFATTAIVADRLVLACSLYDQTGERVQTFDVSHGYGAIQVSAGDNVFFFRYNKNCVFHTKTRELVKFTLPASNAHVIHAQISRDGRLFVESGGMIRVYVPK